MTETTQPDPQVVAWMRGYLRDNPGASRVDLMRGYRNTDGSVSLRELNDAAEAALYPQPLTVADIPAGQGPASLFIRAGFRGINEVVYKRSDGSISPKVSGAGPEDAAEALREHLAATLPHVTAEETP